MVLYPSADEIRQRQQQIAARHSVQSMAGRQGQGDERATSSFLSPNQQDLLLAALNSQVGARQTYPQPSNTAAIQGAQSASETQPQSMNGANDDGLFMSPQQAEFDGLDYTPDLDYLEEDGFDFENADLGGEMIGALPGDRNELHEKRKNSEEGNGSDEGDAKRQETQDGKEGAKKPGRKPLTSEPTTKRKAQNRAAQRAFRERKEKHLKDLETKVTDLTKTQEADKHENGLLKAQIDRLQTELKEYRKRLSLNGGSGANRSPPLAATAKGRSNGNTSPYGSGSFQFDFPKFGGLPGSQIFGNQGFSNGSSTSLGHSDSVTPPIAQSPTHGSFSGPSQRQPPESRSNSMGPSMSPNSLGGSNTGSPGQVANLAPAFTTYSTNTNMHGFASTLPQMNGAGGDPFGDLFSPSILKGDHVDSTGNYFPVNGAQMNGSRNAHGGGDVHGGDSTAGLNRVFQFNSNNSTSDSASPSASSASQWNANANSSCGTSPEPSHDSPSHQTKTTETFASPLSNQLQEGTATKSPANNLFSSGDYGVPSLDSFDPVLFGDYRENQDGILGGGEFTGGFFDEALNPTPFDMASPSNLFGILQSPQQSHANLSVPSSVAANAPSPSKNLMAEMDKVRDGCGDDYGLQKKSSSSLSSEGGGKLISCNSIWNQLQSNPDFQEGKFDLDGLCSELKAKARCSESGVMVDQDHVDQALRKLGKKDDKGKAYEGPAGLMFEQESWDNVLKKLGNNKA